jgi:hypothetical protein
MKKDILASVARLTDDELAARVKSLAAREHATAACVIAHLAEMDTRDIHLRAGYPRLYDYCLKVLHLSEWEAWNRIEAGRVARRFPILFDMLEEGSIHLTGIKLLAPHLTDENHRRVLEAARWKSKLAIGEIVARLHPLPDVPTSIVPIPEFAVVPQPAPPALSLSGSTTPPGPGGTPEGPTVASPPPPARPATLTPLSPQRYKLQVTISGETLEKLRRAKDLLGHVVAAGDDDAVLNRALTVLLDKLTREKCARRDKPRPGRPRHPRARRPSAAVRRIVWERDGGRCKFISPDGHRCEETRRIEPHHLDPWVLAGDVDSPDGYELRCQRHNDYEGRLYFGKRRRGAGKVCEPPTPYGVGSFSTELVPEQRQPASRCTRQARYATACSSSRPVFQSSRGAEDAESAENGRRMEATILALLSLRTLRSLRLCGERVRVTSVGQDDVGMQDRRGR